MNPSTLPPQPAVPFGGFSDPRLLMVAAKVAHCERLSRADGLALLATADWTGLGWLANLVRERLHGLKTYYNINRHINYTNLCVNQCKFCSFARRAGEPGAWEYSLEEIFEKAVREAPPGLTELHIVGGLHPSLPFDYYLEMLRGLKARLPRVHLKAFTAVEIAYFAKISGLKVETVLERLLDAGLGSLPGGGAEVLTPRSRQLICGEKLTGQGWLNIHRLAHRLGLKSNSTMLYGHVETDEDRIDHLLALRALQDETGGFQAFIPLAFHPVNSGMAHLPAPTGLTDLRVTAVARLMLDNIPHVKAYWISLGIKTAQIAQCFGANDMDGTVVEETIYHMAGADSPQALGVRDLQALIREAGRVPVERDSLYREIQY